MLKYPTKRCKSCSSCYIATESFCNVTPIDPIVCCHAMMEDECIELEEINNIEESEIWRIYSLDVWGNSNDGFEVNDRYKTSTFLELPPDFTDEQLLDALNKEWFNKTITLDMIDIDGDNYYININNINDDRPIIQLEREA